MCQQLDNIAVNQYAIKLSDKWEHSRVFIA